MVHTMSQEWPVAQLSADTKFYIQYNTADPDNDGTVYSSIVQCSVSIQNNHTPQLLN